MLYSGLDPASTGCTWDGATLEFVDVGTCLLDATFPATGGYAATPVQLSVPIGPAENLYEGRDRASGEPRWTATSVDLVFGSNSQLRALSEV